MRNRRRDRTHPMDVNQSATIRLSVLDQSPVSSGSTPAQALRHSIELAQHVESLGYRRFWMSEHHAMDLLACTAPEIMLARIGGETSTIRLGSGGIMLPHYTPLKVAETFRTLHALYPGRIDLGIGRAPGGGPIEATALRRYKDAPPNAMQRDDFPDQLSELIAFLHHGLSCAASVLADHCLARFAGRPGHLAVGVEACGAPRRRLSLACPMPLRTSSRGKGRGARSATTRRPSMPMTNWARMRGHNRRPWRQSG